MQKRLNTDKVNQAMEDAGFSQADLARKLDVSKEAVSQWLKHKSFPRPNKLLMLGKLLQASFSELVLKEDEPLIAFRKMKGTKTTQQHIDKARDMGNFLRHLVPYLPFDTLEVPPVLKNPEPDYEYLQTVVAKVRQDINLGETDTVDFVHLIKRFRDLQAVIVPVLWGSKQRHENAVHIYLPSSQTTWVYLNLDVNIHDFKFWMAHELGHCLSPSLRGEQAEDFADAFAGALLFPRAKVEKIFAELKRKRSKKTQLDMIMKIANQEMIAPFTIYVEVNKYADHMGEYEFELEPDIFKYSTRLNAAVPNLSQALFGDSPDNVEHRDYIEKVSADFDTPFFDMLGQYLKEEAKGAGFVQAVMDMPLLDARGIYDELV